MDTEGTTVVPQTPLSPVASMAKTPVTFPVPGFAHVKASPTTSEKEAGAAVDTCEKQMYDIAQLVKLSTDRSGELTAS